MHQSTRRPSSGSKSSSLRIIGGRWKGRRIKFNQVTGLRPTLDRVRETLFNWLMYDIEGARCLDLFAGSGALGLEALSRGAAEVVFVEKSNKAAANIHRAVAQLEFTNAKVLNTSAEVVVKKNTDPYDVIFIDPPFYQDYLTRTLAAIDNEQFLKPGSLVYVEREKHSGEFEFPEHWRLEKTKQVGGLEFYLLSVNAETS